MKAGIPSFLVFSSGVVMSFICTQVCVGPTSLHLVLLGNYCTVCTKTLRGAIVLFALGFKFQVNSKIDTLVFIRFQLEFPFETVI